jgi:uroporphyrinogen-III synthase
MEYVVQVTRATILSTRPVEPSLIQKAANAGVHIDTTSLIEVERNDTTEVLKRIRESLTQQATVVFTSMNAVEAVAAELNGQITDWRIYCIGNTTKELVDQVFGRERIAGTANDASALARVIVEDDSTNDVTFFCGDKHRKELPELLRKSNIAVTEVEVYKTKALHQRIQKIYDGILFYSPSAVDSFFSDNTVNDNTVLFAIGNTTAAEIRKFATNTIITSEEPGKEQLIEKAIKHFQVKDQFH